VQTAKQLSYTRCSCYVRFVLLQFPSAAKISMLHTSEFDDDIRQRPWADFSLTFGRAARRETGALPLPPGPAIAIAGAREAVMRFVNQTPPER
jgi:hypothetical protein